MAHIVSPPARQLLRMLTLMAMLCVISLSGCDGKVQPKAGALLPVEIAGRTFHLELALDEDARFQGLSDRPSIDADGGMLFVFPRPRELNFVMRRCLVPIDLIYLGPGGRIVSMHTMQVVPYDTPEFQLKYYNSGWPAQFAVELKAGSIDELGLKTGQKIDLPLQALKQLAR